jgi:hypothetical protein
MRAFGRLRNFYALSDRVETKVDRLEQDVTQIFKVIFEKLDNLETNLPTHNKERRKIGIS